MDIDFASKKLQKIINAKAKLRQEFGENAPLIMRRMVVLQAAANLGQISTDKPERCHELTGNLKGIFAVDLKHPFRLLFKPNHDPVPVKEDGGIDRTKVIAITILKVEDYH